MLADPQHAVPQAAIDALWTFFRLEHRWPCRKEFLLLAEREQLSIEPGAFYSNVSIGRGAQDPVRPAFHAITALEDVRALLAPLPAVLRRAAATFAAQALVVPDNTLPTLHFREISPLWSDVPQAREAFHVLRDTDSTMLVGGGSGGSDPDDFWFSLSIEVLRYENVRDLDDVLRVRRYAPAVQVGRFPSGDHLEVLRRIYAASSSEMRWPRALQFALGAREVGYIPDLVRDLSKRFIRGEFQASNRHYLVLTPLVLPFVDPSGKDRELFVRVVRAIVHLWRARSEPAQISIDELAGELSTSTDRLGPVVALLEWSEWGHVGHINDDSHRSLVFVPGDPELVLRNKDLKSFDEYLLLWYERPLDEMTLQPAALPEATSPPLGPAKGRPAIHVPKQSIAFLTERYAQVLQSDLEELERTIDAHAWKASLILIGGVIECALLDVLSRRENVAQSVLRKPLSRASLMDLIEGAEALRLIPPSVKPFAEVAKDYRDLTHPFRSAVSLLRPGEGPVRAMMHALELVLTDLETARVDGRLSAFESQ